jgi:hypothetical protein
MRYKEIDINIKAIPDKEDEEILNQLIGAKKATVSTDTEEAPSDNNNSDNPGKVASDDPNTKPPMYPLQQELELQKKAAGKDLAQFDNIVQDADQQAEDEIARKDGPLVQQPETTKGDNPGVPNEMKGKQPKNESEFVQTLKTLSGQN